MSSPKRCKLCQLVSNGIVCSISVITNSLKYSYGDNNHEGQETVQAPGTRHQDIQCLFFSTARLERFLVHYLL